MYDERRERNPLILSEIVVDGELYLVWYEGRVWAEIHRMGLWGPVHFLDRCQIRFGEGLWALYIGMAWALFDIATLLHQ